MFSIAQTAKLDIVSVAMMSLFSLFLLLIWYAYDDLTNHYILY